MSGGSADYNSREHGGPEGMDPNGVIKSNWNEIVGNFDDMNLKESLLRGIYAYGLEKPSAIQQRAIIPCIKDPKGNSGTWRLWEQLVMPELVEQMFKMKCKNCRLKHHILLLEHQGECLIC